MLFYASEVFWGVQTALFMFSKIAWMASERGHGGGCLQWTASKVWLVCAEESRWKRDGISSRLGFLEI